MNEFKLIDDVMPDVPPSDPGRMAEARARVLNDGRSRWRFGWTAAAVAAATVAVIVPAVVVPRLGAPVVSSVPDPRHTLEPDPRQALEAAADMARRSEPGSGDVWRATMEITTQVQGSRYSVNERVLQTLWRSRHPVTMLRERRLLGVQPVTPADRAAWKRAGSPKLCESTIKCVNGTLFLKPGQTEYEIYSREKAPLLRRGLVGFDLRPSGDIKLSGDPAALKSELLKSWPTYRDDPQRGKTLPGMSMDEWLWSVGTSLPEALPLSPATRAALYLMLADLPGARVFSQGDEVIVARPFQTGYAEDRVVIDRATGTLVAIRKVLVRSVPRDKGSGADRPDLPLGTVTHEVAFVKVGWTEIGRGLPMECAPSINKTGQCVR
ncbi:hypothetical protein SAMN05216276_102289 [Streptosporangium subroseum]|uniref:Uncharacterized protein n=1 Tax=Streptosporangium subroseum TaxID=106412 RepID=A0A239JE41_9ACTN|nr:hypothetical protein [Streptosporangium subroseum]SNT04079.1 hypothetical protein SAMN05216276_102289 [Streptosporangium subroseum]